MSMCTRPDRDAPGLTCGYPLPCPWHSVVAEVKGGNLVITVPCTGELEALQLDQITQIVAAIFEDMAGK